MTQIAGMLDNLRTRYGRTTEKSKFIQLSANELDEMMRAIDNSAQEPKQFNW